jgi:hypothetical protein
MNTDPDLEPIRIQGFDGKRLQKKIYKFGSKTTIYLSLGLQKERPSYKEACSFQKRISTTSKYEISKFFYFCRYFWPPGSGSGF